MRARIFESAAARLWYMMRTNSIQLHASGDQCHAAKSLCTPLPLNVIFALGSRSTICGDTSQNDVWLSAGSSIPSERFIPELLFELVLHNQLRARVAPPQTQPCCSCNLCKCEWLIVRGRCNVCNQRNVCAAAALKTETPRPMLQTRTGRSRSSPATDASLSKRVMVQAQI